MAGFSFLKSGIVMEMDRILGVERRWLRFVCNLISNWVELREGGLRIIGNGVERNNYLYSIITVYFNICSSLNPSIDHLIRLFVIS